jgi:hypothetical protein
MSRFSANLYTPDGRLRGSYVYMLLCQIAGPIHIKVGRSSNPFARLESLRMACPVIPQALSVAEVHSHKKAVIIERELHAALKRWHSHLEWFVVEPAEKTDFNAAWKPILDFHSNANRRIHWNHFSVPKLIADARKRAQLRGRNFMCRGKAYRDYTKHGGRL